MSPNPIPAGNNTVTFTVNAATPLIAGGSAVCNGVGLTLKYLSATSMSAGLYVDGGSGSVTCYVSNPDTWRSNSVTVPVKASSSTPAPIVSPAAVTLGASGKQQFTATNVTAWTATAGAISASGLYTAPATLPASNSATVTASGPGGTGAAHVTFQNYSAPTISTISPNALPLGVFEATITGSGFLPASTALLGGTPLIVTAQSATTLSVTGFAGAAGTLSLVAANGSKASTPVSVPVGNTNALVSPAAARRFLEQAAFGPTPSEAANVQNIGLQAWLNQQYALPQLSNYNAEASSSSGGLSTQFLANAVTNQDQLRQKVAFALSQIFVTSINTVIWNDAMIPYEQMLMADAFTNYRQILGDVTLSPAMGEFLNMANNAMGDPALGTMANQNYAREVMQLFTIGTTLLNPDGSPKLDANHQAMPSYTQDVIADTARVFTGWTYRPASGAVQWDVYINPAGPMVPYALEHDGGAKNLLAGFSEPAGFSPQDDLNNTLDNMFRHPNTGPFVSKLLIQH